jgi:murein L,D-transpeptidase YcbB/YkuD
MSVRVFVPVFVALLCCCGAASADDSFRGGVVLASADGDSSLAGQFYQLHGGGLVWHGSQEAEDDARTALETLSDAARDGLDPERYRVHRGGDIAADDAALTTALLAYMRDLAVGRPDLEALDADVALPRPAFDAARLLDQALRQRRLAPMLAGLAPSSGEYAALRSELARDPNGPNAPVIIANMERWRWMPRTIEPDRIAINAADASLALWLGGKPVLTSRVIVGKPATPTPILRADGAGLTVNPAWTVPQSIARKEILPKLKRNHAWLASQDMILLNGPPGDPHGLTVNWRAIPAGTFPYRIRQIPGPRNPLGQIKLELPNRFDVYLHDTPGKTAFTRSTRALSHGCVRVEQILPLASYALNANRDAEDQITQAIDTGETQYLPLQKRLPVYFLYWTAVPDAQGKIQFFPDIYGRDRRLIAAMDGGGQQIAGGMTSCPKG